MVWTVPVDSLPGISSVMVRSVIAERTGSSFFAVTLVTSVEDAIETFEMPVSPVVSNVAGLAVSVVNVVVEESSSKILNLVN